MKFVASPLSILPGAQASQQRATGRKGSDRDADFAAALAMVVAGQQIGPAEDPLPGAKEGVDAKPHLVAPAARRREAPRPGDDAAKAGGKTSLPGAAADPRRPSATGAAASVPTPSQPDAAGVESGGEAPSVGEGMAQTPTAAPAPQAGPARDGVALPPHFEKSALADASSAPRRPVVGEDPIPVKRAATPTPRAAATPTAATEPTAVNAPGAPDAHAPGANGTKAPGANATIPLDAIGTPTPRAIGAPIHPTEIAATGRSGVEAARVPAPPAGPAAPEQSAYRPEAAAAGSVPLAHPAPIASNDDVPDRREAPRSTLHPSAREPLRDGRVEALPLRPSPREAVAASSTTPAPAATAAFAGAVAANVRPVEREGDDTAPSFGAGGSVEVAPTDRRGADPIHLDPRVDATPVSFTPPKEPQAAAPTSTVTGTARPAPLPQEDATLGGLDAGLVLDASGAKLSVRDTRAGDLALDVRISDGSLDIRAGGAAAPVVAANEAELRLALAGAGMRLGQLAIEASVEGRVSAAPLAANTERRRSRDDARETKRIDGKETREAGEEPASIHVKV